MARIARGSLIGAALLIALPCAVACVRQHDEQMVASGDCVTCHQMDYARTSTATASACAGFDTPPPHAELAGVGFTTECAKCHDTMAWCPAVGVNHDWWPLHENHGAPPRECRECHGTGTPLGGFAPPATPVTCITCHATIRNVTGVPDGTAAAAVAIPAGVMGPPAGHVHTDFGALASDCASCHADGGSLTQPNTWPSNYTHAGATDCRSCHQLEYDFANTEHPAGDPLLDHAMLSGTQNCNICHTTTAWKPASGGHPENCFPIATGRHTGIACATCHAVPSLPSTGGMNVDCRTCHMNGPGRTHAGDHDGVGGYTSDMADPQWCFHCHQSGINDRGWISRSCP